MTPQHRFPQMGALLAALFMSAALIAQEPAREPAAAAQQPAASSPAPAANRAPAPANPLPEETAPPVRVPDVPPARLTPAPATSDTPKADNSKLYVLGALDVVYVKVWGNQNLTGPYNIGEDGLMYMPLIGAIKAEGLTQPQLTKAIQDKLGDYYHDPPDVNVELAANHSHKFYIMGEGAAHPGQFPLNEPTTISEALAMSGGFTGFANTKKIYVLRGTKKFPFNYKEVISGKNLKQDIQLENGDKIVIPQ
jgi:polysaccharide biosynthesis/export protein